MYILTRKKMCNNIRNLLVNQRKERKIKQKDVAEFIGITPVSLSRYENGITTMKIKYIEKYAEYLGLEFKLFLR